jgi:antitoxin ParD1/3/4
MHIEFAAVDARYIKDSVKQGYFRSEAEAVRDAVRRAREEREANQERLLAALQLGDDDIAAGRVKPYTPALFAKIKKDAVRHAKAGRKPKADVLP